MAQTTRPINAEQIPASPTVGARLTAEAVGTFVLVVVGVGTVLFGGLFPGGGEFYLPIALAFGLAVVAGAFAFGHISGAHFNPAVTVGVALAKRLAWKDVPSYIGAQLVGGILGAAVLFAIAAGGPDGFLSDAQASGFASTGFGERSPAGFGLASVMIAEIVLTAIFVWVILGATDRRAPVGFAPIGIGLGLTMVLLAGLSVSGASINPARSVATAIFGDGLALGQLWVFIVAPIIGGVIAGATYKVLFDRHNG